MNLPESIEIGHLEYTVEEVKDMVAGTGSVSVSFAMLNKIQIQAGMAFARQRMSLFVGCHLGMLDLGIPDLEKKDGLRLSHHLYAILRENPLLVDVKNFETAASVKILGDFWAIKSRPGTWHQSGEVESTEMVISINESLPLRERWQTMWHEVYHRAFYYSGFEDEPDSYATIMSHLLCNFMSQNDLAWMWYDAEAVGDGEDDVPFF